MHLRSSQIRGIPIIDDGTQQIAGFLDSPLMDPDTGRILGFFVIHSFLPSSALFLQTLDIVAWGTRVHIRSEDCLSPPEELIRLRSALEDPRSFIGQRIRVKGTNRYLGICSDVQFSTKQFLSQWIFPRKFFIARQPLPMSDVLEVTPDAVWVRDPMRTVRLGTQESSEHVSGSVLTEVVPSVQVRQKM